VSNSRNLKELTQFISKQLNERERFYDQADITISAISVDIENLIEKITAIS
jgi:hypothetical protein